MAEFEFAGMTFRGGKMVALVMALSTLGGGLYGAFEVYKDYTDMKEKIQSYVAPDLSGFDKRLDVMNEQMKKIEGTAFQTNDYVRDIKNDLKSDLRNIEKVIEGVERSTKENQRAMDKDLREVRDKMSKLNEDVDLKITKALENPLSNLATGK